MITSLVLASNLRARIASEARAAAPRECCGLIEGILQDQEARATTVHPVSNLATAADRFEIDPAEHIRLLRQVRETRRTIIGCYHSHPNGKPEPSPYDRECASDDEFIWLIAGLANDEVELQAYVCNAGAFSPVILRDKPA
jgi:proteasome lid subunit RPN8/RPN11